MSLNSTSAPPRQHRPVTEEILLYNCFRWDWAQLLVGVVTFYFLSCFIGFMVTATIFFSSYKKDPEDESTNEERASRKNTIIAEEGQLKEDLQKQARK